MGAGRDAGHGGFRCIYLCASLHYAYIVSIVKPNLVMLVQLIMLDLTCEALYRGPNLTRKLLNFKD